MSICNEPDCGSSKNIWTISNDNSAPPYYQTFDICNDHLKNSKKFREMNIALVEGRLNGCSGDRVKFSGWNLERKADTWVKSMSLDICSECEKAEKIWLDISKKWVSDDDDCYPYGGFEYTIICLCDDHFNKKTVSKKPAIKGNGIECGLTAIEETW